MKHANWVGKNCFHSQKLSVITNCQHVQSFQLRSLVTESVYETYFFMTKTEMQQQIFIIEIGIFGAKKSQQCDY